MADHQLAVLTPDGFSVLHRDQGKVNVDIQKYEGTDADVGLEGYDHYMLKEIYEQPESLRNAMRGRLDVQDATAVFGGLESDTTAIAQLSNRIILTGCGTSWHSALVGEYLIEELARIPVSVEYASELRYRNPPIDNNTLVFRHHPKWRDRRYTCRSSRNETQRAPYVGDLQRGRQLHRSSR